MWIWIDCFFLLCLEMTLSTHRLDTALLILQVRYNNVIRMHTTISNIHKNMRRSTIRSSNIYWSFMSSFPSMFMLDLSLQSSSGNFNLCARDCLFLWSTLFVNKKHYFNRSRKLQNNVLHKTDDRCDLVISMLQHSYSSLLCNSRKTFNVYKKSLSWLIITSLSIHFT